MDPSGHIFWPLQLAPDGARLTETMPGTCQKPKGDGHCLKAATGKSFLTPVGSGRGRKRSFHDTTTILAILIRPSEERSDNHDPEEKIMILPQALSGAR